MLSRQTAIRCCYLVAFLVRNFKIKLQCLYVWIMLQFSTQSYFRDSIHIYSLQDLFAVGMFFPLFNRRGRQLGASPSVIGLIGTLL